MRFRLEWSPEAAAQHEALSGSLLKQVDKALAHLQENPFYPGLHSHKYETGIAAGIFESYAQNNTPNAYRIFWQYGENQTIVIVAIVGHP
jgi:mRNA-degrading endonuclease RelE of RelBE toxin-antitoxin system